MGFVIIENQKVSQPQIRWKFADREREFLSFPEKFEKNVQYWRNALYIAADVEVIVLNGEPLPKLETVIENAEPIIAEPAIESRVSELDVQQHLPDSLEGPLDPGRKKPRRKTT